MDELSTAARDAWIRADRRRMVRARLRVRRAALDGRLGLRADLLAPLAAESPHVLAQWRAGLHHAIADELRQRAGIALTERFLADAHAAALAEYAGTP